MLSEQELKSLVEETKLRGAGINPDRMVDTTDADSYRYTPEFSVPDTPMPEPDRLDSEFRFGGGLSASGQFRPDMQPPQPEDSKAEQLITQADKALRETNIWKRYTFSREDVLQEARNISIETGIPESAMLADPKNMDNARSVYDYRRKQMALLPPGENEVSMDKIIETYPGLKTVLENGNDTEAALALHNLENVKQVHGLVEAATAGWKTGMLQHQIANIGRKGMMQGKGLTEEDYRQVEQLKKQIADIKKMPGLFEDPITAIVGGTSQQVRQQLTGAGRGTLYGAALAAVAVGAGALTAPVTGGLSVPAAIGAAKAGFALGMRAGWAVDMWEESAASRFVEYTQFKDQNGKRVLSDNEAAAYAAAAGALETGIEFANTGMILKALKGNKTSAAESIRAVVAGATDTQTLLSGLRRVLHSASAIAVSESAEEGGQELADRLLSNAVYSYKGGTIPHYTIGEVFAGALENAVAAFPASVGFGVMATGGGSVKLVRQAAALSELGDLNFRERMKNANGLTMFLHMKNNEKIKEFFKKDSEIAGKVLHDTVQGTGYETVNIDTGMLLQTEGGTKALYDVAEAAGMSQEQVSTAIETKADVTVPYEVFYQTQLKNNFAIGEDFITFSDVDPSFAYKRYYAEKQKAEYDAIMDKEARRNEARRQAALDNILQKNFAEGIERDAAAEILMVRPDDPSAGWNDLYMRYKQQLDDLVEPIVKGIKEFSEQGADSYRDPDTGRVIYGSNNAPWYRDFLKDFGRKPTKEEYRQFAIDALSGRDFSKHPDLQRGSVSDEQFDENAELIDNLQSNIAALEAIKDRIRQIDAVELESVDGMSKEAYDIYRDLSAQITASAPNDNVKRAGRVSAVLLSRHADRYVDSMHAAGHKKYTALDYYRDRFGLRMGGVYEGGGMEQAMFDVSKIGVNTVSQFYAKILERKKQRQPENKLKFVSRSGVIYPEAQVVHAVRKHGLNNQELDDIDIHINHIVEAGISARKGSFHGITILAMVKGNMANYSVVLEFCKDGSVYFKTAAKNTEHGTNVWINKKSAKRLASVKYTNVVSDGRSINNIKQVLGIVNTDGNPVELHQRAYHGSPHSFDTFSLDHVGSGEGNQAHGWGLYFAADKRVSKGYQKRLSTSKKFKWARTEEDVFYNGAPLPPATAKFIDARIHWAFRGEPSKRTEAFERLKREIAQGDSIYRNNYERNKEALSFLRDYDAKNKATSFVKVIEAAYSAGIFVEDAIENTKIISGKHKRLSDVIRYVEALVKEYDDERTEELNQLKILQTLDPAKVTFKPKRGSFFKVELPENDVLLDEDKLLNEQPEKVREAIAAYYNSRPDDYIAADKDHLGGQTGLRFYREVSRQMQREGSKTPDKDASLLLNSLGIKGITYDGRRDGRCFVVFDDKAIDVLNIMHQRQTKGNGIQGATYFEDTGRRLVSVFESADESTLAHELGHIFLEDLKEMAAMPNAPEQVLKDWEKMQKWLDWKPGQEKLTTAQQEKFARGWEAYLRTGNAPATSLQAVFRKFKAWLTQIYRDFLQLGGKPSEEVQAIMGRMIATDEEVETAFKLRELNAFEQAGGFDYVAEDSRAMYSRWTEEALAYAKEKTMVQAMKDLTVERQEKMEEDIRAQLENTPLYKAAARLEVPGVKEAWDLNVLGMTQQEFNRQIKQQGTLEQAVKRQVRKQMKEVKDGMPLSDIKAEAEKAVDSSQYRGMMLAFEQEFINKKLRKDAEITPQIEKALAEIEKAAYEADGEQIWKEDTETDQIKALRHRIKELKYQARWEAAERDLIAKMEKSKSREELKSAVQQFKSTLKKNREHIRVYRDATVANVKLIREYAVEKMAEMPISEATNVRKWQQQAQRAGRESAEAMKRALHAGLRYSPPEKGLVPVAEGQQEPGINAAGEAAATETLPTKSKVPRAQESSDVLWRQAYEAKLRQRIFTEYAALAQKNKDKVRKQNARLKARQGTIAKKKDFPAIERYMYGHGLYVLGLTKKDVPKPQEDTTLLYLFQYYADDLSAFFTDEDGNVSLPDHIMAAMAGSDLFKSGYESLKLDEYLDFVEVLNALYTIGRDANKLKSVKDPNGSEVYLRVITESIVTETASRVPLIKNTDITNAGGRTTRQKIADHARKARVELTKIERILEWMGPAAHRYVYETVNQAWNKEQLMQEQAAVAVKAIWQPYTDEEKTEMRSKRQFMLGTSALTREEVLCIAFNWGTLLNRRRIVDGFGITEAGVVDLLSNLTEKDWDMVRGVWKLVESYWPETARVEEEMAGIAPQKQSAIPFQIIGKDGKTHILDGGYYPIKYDPTKSLAAANQQQDDAAKQRSAGNAAMERGRSHVKQRTEGKVERPVLLSFNVLTRHLDDVIHNICFRAALRDVNRILKNPEVVNSVIQHFGLAQVQALQQWVRDCWALEVTRTNSVDQVMEFFRHKQTAATLAFRVPTAALNSLNVFPMVHYLGPARAWQAVSGFYAAPREKWNFAMSRSVFLRNRAETMDRDAREILQKEFIGGYGKVADTVIRAEKEIEKHAFTMLAYTDLALAVPLWTSEYERVYQEMTGRLESPAAAPAGFWERVEMEATMAGDKAVRQVFGSGEMKDLAPIQKGSELCKALTMFYSYFSVVFNALYKGYGEGRRLALPEGAIIKMAPVVNAILCWVVLTGTAEGLLKVAMDWAVGDEPEDGKDVLKKMFKAIGENASGPIPVFRDVFGAVLDRVMGDRYWGTRPLPLYATIDNVDKLWQTMESDKKTKIDVLREGARIINSFTGMGNAITDAFATTAYWIDEDFDTAFYEYLFAVLLDKRIDKKKK